MVRSMRVTPISLSVIYMIFGFRNSSLEDLNDEPLHCIWAAVEIFGNLLQQPTNNFSEVNIKLPFAETLQLLGVLQNTSIKKLGVLFLLHHHGNDEAENRRTDGVILGRLTELFRHKHDIESLHFADCTCDLPAQILPIFRRRDHFTYLRVLELDNCYISDDIIESLVQALVDGGHNLRINHLCLMHNDITSDGLEVLCKALVPASFRCLETLILNDNARLLENDATTQRFIEKVWLAPGTALRALDVAKCSYSASSHVLLLKSCETNHVLRELKIGLPELSNEPTIRNQLVDSLPKIKGLRHLAWSGNIFRACDNELMAALRQNSSLLEIRHFSHRAPSVDGALKRNEYFLNLDDMLGTDISTVSSSLTRAATGARVTQHLPRANSTAVPRSLWPRVVAKVGQDSEGASPVFQILQAQLASCPESVNYGQKKRKHQATLQRQLQ